MDFEITPTDLKHKLDSGDAPVIVDVREAIEVQIASIPGVDVKHMPMGDVPSRAHQELDEDAHIVVICHHGVRSANVVMWLRGQGFDRAQSLRGGIDQWSKTVDPSVPTY